MGWALQAEQHGTGHAVMQAMPAIPDDHLVLVLYGDVPLVQLETLARLVARGGRRCREPADGELADPTGYGRIVRDGAGSVVRIVEHKDANAAERAHPRVEHRAHVRAGRQRCKGWLGGAQERQRPGRVLPHRHHRHGREARAARCTPSSRRP